MQKSTPVLLRWGLPLLLFVGALLFLALGGRKPSVPSPVDTVWPMIGAGGDGHTYPGAVVPFGFVQLSPDTGTHQWEHASGYRYSDPTIIGFSHTHLSGTGCSDLGDILFQPTTGEVRMDRGDEKIPNSGYRSRFSHRDESATPGYYRVLLLDYGIKVELTATAHAGFHRYTFPASDQSHVIIDLSEGIESGTKDAMITREDDSTLSGFRHSGRWAQDKTFYFVAKFSRPFDSCSITGIENSGHNTAVKGCFNFKTSAGESIMVKVGLSATSVDEARKNFDAEIPDWDFEGTAAAAREAWSKCLSTVEIETSDPAVRETFYTALYHSMVAPHFFNNADKSYFGADGKTHAADFNYYSTFSVWDQFRAWHPLMTIVQPNRVNDMLKSMLVYHDQLPEHVLPVWTLCSNETWCMIGYNSLPVIADAYAKDFRDYDAEKMYAAMRESAMFDHGSSKIFHQTGFISHGGDMSQSVSQGLEYSYDDWCLAQMAQALGKKDDTALFFKSAASYRNYFDPSTHLMRGKNVDGSFITPFDPLQYDTASYTEANAWQYSFYVPHDVEGLAQLMGGDDQLAAKIDELFGGTTDVHNRVNDITGQIGQYAHGNEPSHHMAYLYNYVGQPYKTQQRVRQIMDTLYFDRVDGICGNDDCGQMSAWYVLSAMGFYPVNPADGIYVIGSPRVDKAVLHLDSKFYPGGTFTITAKDNSPQNIYIQSARFNGQPLARSYITHADLVKGGALELQMGPKPNLQLWSEKTARPPSMTPLN